MITSSKKERGIETASKENKAPLHLMSYRGRERAFAHAHTHSEGQNILYTVFSTEKNN